MKYRSRTVKTLSDQNVIGDLSKAPKGLLQNSPASTSNFFTSLFQYFIGAMAFLSRSFLRANLGERTFGVLTILSIIFFVGIIQVFPSAYDATYKAMSFNKEEGGWFLGVIVFFLTFLYPIYILILGKLMRLNPTEYFQSIDTETSSTITWFLVIILVITLGQIAEVYSRKKQRIVVHSFYRGDSLLFRWLENKRLFGTKISKLAIWMLVEPVFVLAMAFLLGNILGYEDVALLLQISAICLFVEELRVYQENRRFELDMLDGQLDAAYAMQLQQKYEGSVDDSKMKSPKEFRSSFGQQETTQKENQGSTTNFRVKIH